MNKTTAVFNIAYLCNKKLRGNCPLNNNGNSQEKIHVHLTLRTRYAHGKDTHTWKQGLTLLCSWSVEEHICTALTS